MTDTNRKCDEVPGTNGFECGQCPFDNVCDIAFVEEEALIVLPGDYTPEGGRVIVTIHGVMRDLNVRHFTLCKIVQGAVSLWCVYYPGIESWGSYWKDLDDLLDTVPLLSDEYVYTWDRLYPIFPPRLMQDLDTGEYNKRDPNLDYVQRQRKRRGLHK